MKDLKEIFAKYNINVSQDQADMFDEYFSMLVETNKHLNLTAITEERDVLIKHFLDSALPEKIIPQNATLVDVGTGAGFPALPLKIVRPDLKVCLVDSLNKRVNFLKDVCDKLKLENVSAVHSRAEDFAKNNREKFDVAVARAVAQLNTLTEYLLPLVKVGGIAVIYKSSKLDEELREAKKAIEILGAKVEKIEKIVVDEENLERNILVLKKVKNTPNKYPRDKNKPKLDPIK